MKRWLVLIFIFLASLTVLFLLDNYYRGQVNKENDLVLAQAIENAEAELANAIHMRINAVEDLKAFMLAPGTLPDFATFDRFAANLLSTYPTIRTLQYVDMSRIIRHTYPLAGNEAAIGIDLMTRPAASFVEKAIQEQQLTVNNPTVTVQGSLSIVARAPLYRDDEFLGLAQGVFDIETMLEDVLGKLDSLFAVQLHDAAGAIFWGPEAMAQETRTATIPVGDNTWTITVGWHGAAPGPDIRILGPLWGLGGALLLSLLYIVNQTWTRTTSLANAMTEKTEELALRNQQLETEIAVREQAEQALHESAVRFKSIFEHAPIAIGLVDMAGYSLESNSALHTMLGYTADELTALTFTELAHPEDGARDMRFFQELRENQRDAYQMEKRYYHKSGEIVWGELSVALVRDKDQNPQYAIGMVRDITERKQVEKALREGEEKLRLFIEHAPASLAMFDHEMRYLAVSNRWMTDYSLGERDIIGQSHYEVFPEVPDRWKTAHRRGLAGEVLKVEDDVFERADGIIQLLRWEIRPWYTDNGIIGGIVIFSEDVTERKLAEDALRQYNRRLRILHDIDQGIINARLPEEIANTILQHLTELIVSSSASIFLVNEAITEATVYASIGEIDMPVGERISVGDNVFLEQFLSGQTLLLPDFGQIDVSHMKLGTHYLEAGVKSSLNVPLFVHNQLIGLLVLMSQVVGFFTTEHQTIAEEVGSQFSIAIYQARLTEQIERHNVELEDRVRQRTAQLEATNEELDTFAHTVAHDLKNPLSGIVLYAGILKKYYNRLNEEKRQSHLDSITENAHKMNNIIEALLLLAGVRKMEDVHMSKLDMAGILVEVRQSLQHMIQEYQAEITWPDVWPAALGYAPWVEEVWINYLSNAFKYGGQPPAIELGADVLENGMVRFWIRDNGLGLTPEEQAQVFTPFTRLDQAQIKGYGLGLSIVQRIVEKLDGEVGVESEPDAGSTFSFTLPGVID